MLRNTFVYIRNFNRKFDSALSTINKRRLVRSNGFSLLEFVIVLIITTILASILIPKFSGLQGDAHKKSVQLSANSLRATVNVIHTVWQSQGSRDEIVLIEGYGKGKVFVGKTGWPIDVVDIDTSHESHKGSEGSEEYFDNPVTRNNLTCQRLWNGLLKDAAPTLESDSGQGVFYRAEFKQGKCRFRYLLNEDGFYIEYDLITGQVNSYF